MGARQHAAGWLTGAILLGMPSRDTYAEPEGNRTVTVVLLALLILAVIGALFGIVLGRRADQGIDDPQSLPSGGKSAVPSATASKQGVIPGEQCPPFLQDAIRQRDSKAATPVVLVLYIQTAKSEVWICREPDGDGLWYQGHDKRNSFYNDGKGDTPEEGRNGLLLNNVQTLAGGERYRVSNGATNYIVSRKELQVEGSKGYTDPVVDSSP